MSSNGKGEEEEAKAEAWGKGGQRRRKRLRCDVLRVLISMILEVGLCTRISGNGGSQIKKIVPTRPEDRHHQPF